MIYFLPNYSSRIIFETEP